MNSSVFSIIALGPVLLGNPAQMVGAPADRAAQVNTFIGTKDDGNTFPGASAPFGLIQVSPIGAHYAGWRNDDPAIRGFGHSFISGAGSWEQGGQLSVLPVVGRIDKGVIAPGRNFWSVPSPWMCSSARVARGG